MRLMQRRICEVVLIPVAKKDVVLANSNFFFLGEVVM